MRSPTLKNARSLLSVVNGEKIRESAFGASGKRLLQVMEAEGIVHLQRENARSRTVVLKNRESLDAFLGKEFGINSLQGYIEALSLEDPSRFQIAQLGEDDKLRSINPKSGMHLNSPDGVVICIDDREVKLDFPENCALFVGKRSDVVIPEECLIVGVENFENIKFNPTSRSLFPEGKPIVMIERGPVLRSLLASIPNDYLHFGDIDLPGIAIFQNEYLPITGKRGKFFIPDDIEKLLDEGHGNLHETHEKKYRKLTPSTKEIAALMQLILAKKKRLAQEYFI